jgi:hypothetical protein
MFKRGTHGTEFSRMPVTRALERLSDLPLPPHRVLFLSTIAVGNTEIQPLIGAATKQRLLAGGFGRKK